jgi:hypothetical protein
LQLNRNPEYLLLFLNACITVNQSVPQGFSMTIRQAMPSESRYFC